LLLNSLSILGKDFSQPMHAVFLFLLINQLKVINNSSQMSQEYINIKFCTIMHFILTIASFEELVGVFLREKKGLTCKHRQQIGKSETAERRNFDVGFQFVKRIAIVFHPVS
jgi:hypothetical protein